MSDDIKSKKVQNLVLLVNEISLVLKCEATASITGMFTIRVKKDVFVEVDAANEDLWIVNFAQEKRIILRALQGIAKEYGYTVKLGTLDKID